MPSQSSFKKSLWVIALLVLVAVIARFVLHGAEKPKTQPADRKAQEVPVRVATAQRGDLDLSLKVIGSAQAYSTVTVQARVAGQVQTLAFKPGGHVHRGQTIIRIDPSLLQAQLDEALGNLARDQAQRVNAVAVRKRYEPLLAKGYVSKSSIDTYNANVGLYTAVVKSDQAAVEFARTQLGYAQITAPFDSIAGAPLAYPGAQVAANSTPLVVLNQVQPIHVQFAVPESDLAGLKAAYARGPVAVAVTLPGSKQVMQARLDFINNAVDSSTGTIQLKAAFDNADDQLTPGQFVEVSLPSTQLSHVVTVPAVALQHSPKGSFVFVLDVANKVHQRMVTVGVSTSDRVVISTGLNGGERVVTDGQLLLVDGARVQVAGQ
jgi:multidrug efflux system membrane fusion protein